MNQKQNLDPATKQLIYALHILFEPPSIVLVQGETWKDGKTDFSLYLSEWLLKIKSWFSPSTSAMPIVSEVASNIDTKGHYPQITDLISIKQWLFGSNRRKLYVCDEANEHLKNRRTMSNKNVGFIDLVPQVSKAHGRMIVIGHDFLGVDKELLNDTWCKGIFIKHGRKNAKLISRLLPEEYFIENIPATTISFDPYDVAPLTEKPTGSVYFKDKDKQLLWDWCNGKSAKELGLHRMQIHRLIRKFVAHNLENEVTSNHHIERRI